MSWGVRGPANEIQPVRKPVPVDAQPGTETARHPALRELNQAVDIAQSGGRTAQTSQLADTISVLGYEPPEDAIQSAVGS